MRRICADGAATRLAQCQRFGPAFDKALPVLGDQLRDQGHGLGRQLGQFAQAVFQHHGQTGTFPLAGTAEIFDHFFGQWQHHFAPVLRGGLFLCSQAQNIGYRERVG